jgi:tryptophanyl-tRNA synthetase
LAQGFCGKNTQNRRSSLTTEVTPKRKRVVSGMRPTGRLHIGHYFGALQNWEHLQNAKTESGAPEYECFYFVADWHALTSDYADTSAVAQNTIEITTDYLAAGVDPEKSLIFLQSSVPEHAELHLLLSMVTPLSWLERVPTYKEAMENIQNKDLHTYGFLGYPALQTADIVIYTEEGVPLYVPVGEDQVSHVELSREIVRRFNVFYGLSITDKVYSALDLIAADPQKYVREKNVLSLLAASVMKIDHKLSEAEQAEVVREVLRHAGQLGVQNFLEKYDQREEYVSFAEVLREPKVLLTKTPRIPGLDGRKMSKSYGNAITLSESDADIRAKTKVMKTDPARQRRSDPGNPDVCPVYDWHKLVSPADTLAWAAAGCRSAGIGCIECKSKMADQLIEWIAPVRERRIEYEKHPARVLEVLDEGSYQARKVAQKTMIRVRDAVFGWKRKIDEIRSSTSEVHDSHG